MLSTAGYCDQSRFAMIYSPYLSEYGVAAPEAGDHSKRPAAKGDCGAASANRRSSIKQILPPLLIALAQQAHQMPAGVQAERTRLAGQLEPGLFRRATAFPVIAA